MARYNNALVDPEYFSVGNAFLGGFRGGLEDQRRKELLSQTDREMGLRERIYDEGQAERQAMMQAQGQQQAQSRAALAEWLQSEGLDPKWANLPEKQLEMALEQHIASQAAPGPIQVQDFGGGWSGVVQDGKIVGSPQAPQRAAMEPKGTWGQPFEGVGPDGQPAMFQSHSGTGEVRPAQVGGQALGPKPPKQVQHFRPQDYSTAKNKLTNIAIAKKQLTNIRSAFDKLKGTMSAGPFADKFTYTQAGKAFDAAVNQFRSTVTGLTRVPGVGSMSDFETRLDQAKMPSRGEYEDVTEQQIQGLEMMVGEMEKGYTDILSEAEPRSQQGQQSKQGPKRVKVDAEGNVVGN